MSTLEKLDLASLDITEVWRDKLREALTEGGKIDSDRFKLTLGAAVDPGKARYGIDRIAAISHVETKKQIPIVVAEITALLKARGVQNVKTVQNQITVMIHPGKWPLLIGLWLVSFGAGAAEFHVATSGNDANPGSAARPFATLARAQQAARTVAGKEPVIVTVHRGIYYLPETLVLTAADSGSATAPVVYQAANGEEAIISGGQRLELKWQPHADQIVKAATPPGLQIDQLFINGERQRMARYPNYDPAVRHFNGYAADAFSPQRAARWADPRGGYIHAMHVAEWGDFHYVITGKGADNWVLYEGGWQNNRRIGMHRQFRMVENIFEELDAPGEWYHDAKAGTL